MLRLKNSPPLAGTTPFISPGVLAAKSADGEPARRLEIRTAKFLSVMTGAFLSLCGVALAQTDPGVQSGNRGTGAVLSSVNANSALLAFFTDGQARFQAV